VNVKIKLCFLIVITLFNLVAHSQAPADSTRNKLEEIKKLLDDGTIDQEEYNKKKAELLGSSTKQGKVDSTQVKIAQPKDTLMEVKKADTMSLTALKERYKAKTAAGCVILSVGTAFWVGDIFYAAFSPKPNSTNADTLASEKVTRTGAEAALGVLGGVATIGGAVFLALGLKDKAIYRRRGKELTMNFTGKEVQFAFRF
jgi:hypothetical protein